MLTLKQLLESDSLATVVAKLNQNFQVLSNSNGGPQGIRGPQGIPGLPGKMGPIGATGAAGPTGTILGVIPFAKNNVNTVGVGPSVITTTEYGNVGPWPSSSYDWLDNYHSNANAGEVFIDHRNNGYWKYLTSPDDAGAAFPGFLDGNPYQYPAAAGYVYPNLGPGSSPTPGGNPGFYAGAGWYFYPGQDPSASGAGSVWTEDFTTYLQSRLQGGSGQSGPYPQGPEDGSTINPLKIANARLVTKYGTVWITSGNDATDSNSDGDLKTSSIANWGKGAGSIDAQPGRYNSGVDRLLFKMSIDGLSYQSNITARGYTGPATMTTPTPTNNAMAVSTDYPRDENGLQFPTDPKLWWPKPQYEITLDKYSPLLFLSHRNDPQSPSYGTYGSLGIYLYTDTLTSATPEYLQPQDPYGNGPLKDNNVSKSIHLFTSRYSPDPMVTWDSSNQPLNSAATLNYGEMVLDFRRVIASNQYVCSLPTDMKLSSDYRTAINGNYDESNSLNLYKYRTFQGYISAINGKSLSGSSTYTWDYGLGDSNPSGTAGTHDVSSGTAGMLTRRTWYGTSVLSSQTFNGITPGTNDYIRVAGMLERGRRFTGNIPGYGPSAGYFQSDLIFYTSQFRKTGYTAGQQITNNDVNPDLNQHNSLPALYISPFRNIGIGTFVGFTGGADLGPLEPLAKLHVHAKENDTFSDPTRIFYTNTAGTSYLATLPVKTFAAAAFSAGVRPIGNSQAVTDVLLGNTQTWDRDQVQPEYNIVNPLSPLNGVFKNAIRTESWRSYNLSTMHLGADPYAVSLNSIGRNGVSRYKRDFQISLSPLSTTTSNNFLAAITGVGIHNLYPRARFHMYGKNLYNEVENGQQVWTPGYTIAAGQVPLGLSGSYPFYGATATNTNSASQVVIDYLANTYNYPVGIYEYQYYSFGVSSGTGSNRTSSPNSAAYPNREVLGVTRLGVPYGGAFLSNLAFPSGAPGVKWNNSYKHGGTANAFWDPQSYVGFNLYRDLSSADGGASIGQNIDGDNADTARWILGTQAATANGHGNNGGAGIISSTQGELGIITIPRGRDGGRPYEQWEQRGLGTRDVLNHMKIVFDKHGNIAVGNAAGWDLDAYPSLKWNMYNGQINYLGAWDAATGFNATTWGPFNYNPLFAPYTTTSIPGGVNYSNVDIRYIETADTTSASLINKRATKPEYIRLEIAAEKAWSRDGRMIQKRGFGYPSNRTITITGSTLNNYIKAVFDGPADTTGVPYSPIPTSWILTTDDEGRIVTNSIVYTFSYPAAAYNDGNELTQNNWPVVIFPHPTEFNQGGPLYPNFPGAHVTPPGAIAAEWWGMSNDFPTVEETKIIIETIQSGSNIVGATVTFLPTTDLRGSANMRLNNFVYGEGFGYTGNIQDVAPGTLAKDIDYTSKIVQEKRQESPKIILSFLEKTPTTQKTNMGIQNVINLTPYLKVNTVIASAQNETSLREYWIPKAANTGGTFMVFTDFLGQKEKDVRFNATPLKNDGALSWSASGLFIEEVVTQEFLAGYKLYRDVPVKVTDGKQRSTASPVSGFPQLDYDTPLYNYMLFNKNYVAITPVNMYPGFVRYYNRAYNLNGAPAYFQSGEFGQIVRSNRINDSTVLRTQADPIKSYSTFSLYAKVANNNSTTLVSNVPSAAFGSNGQTTLMYQTRADTTTSPGYNWRLKEDSVLSPYKTGNADQDVVGTVAIKVNVPQTNSPNQNYAGFSRNLEFPFPENPQGVKVTIKLKANAFFYDSPLFKEYMKLGIRLMYATGDGYSIEAFRAGLKQTPVGSTQSGLNQAGGTYMTLNSDTNKLVATFNITPLNWGTFAQVPGYNFSIDGEDSIYMDWAQWNTRDTWFLCFAYQQDFTYGQSPGQWVYSPYTQTENEPPARKGRWHIDCFDVKFEYVWPEAGMNTTEINSTAQPASPASSIRRNIDKYYEIYKPVNSYQPSWGNIPGEDNQATQIRVKRINSEFALVDYNITVKVNNPPCSPEPPFDPSSYIDFGSPRYTQYLRFLYIPDKNGSAGETKRVYGDDLSLINWSSYKNWLPGTAIVGDDFNTFSSENSTDADVGQASCYPGLIGGGIRTMTNDWSPFYNDNYSTNTSDADLMYFSPMTWNGNILEMVSYTAFMNQNRFIEEAVGKGNTRHSTLTRPLRSFYNSFGFQANGSSEDYARNTAYAAFGSDLRILGHAYSLFPYTLTRTGVIQGGDDQTDEGVVKQLSFVGYLGSMYALWKNESFIRNKNTQWRILPAQPYQSLDNTLEGNIANRSFYLEVQLSTPILHVDTPLGSDFYGQKYSQENLSDTVTPYRYLTLNGQAIVKFATTNNFQRPVVEPSE